MFNEEDETKEEPLPENVQKALELAKKKNSDGGHSDFYYKLENLNTKIAMFKNWTPFRPGLL